MLEFFASLALALVVGFLIVRAWHQKDLLEHLPPALPEESPGEFPRVAVIVPARDEASNIGPCLTSLLGQDYPRDSLAIIAVDDGSSDGTPLIVSRMADTDSMISLLRSPPLMEGWTGKCQACWHGANAADRDTEYLCFIDADMRAEPMLLRTTIRAAVARSIGMLSLAPRHQLFSFAERLILPNGHYLLGFRQDLARRQAPDSSDATVTGQFLLVRRSAYLQVGGHAAVRGVISEDVALARLVKNARFTVLLMGGNRLISTRMYCGWAGLWHGIGKNLVDMLGGPVSTITTAVAAVVLSWTVYLLPVVDFAGCRAGSAFGCAGLAFVLPAAAAAIGLHVAGAHYFRIPTWYGLLFPVAYTVGAFIAFDSVRRRFTGQVRWKDRIYP
jgi:chlorobactene glucosyltransferase